VSGAGGRFGGDGAVQSSLDPSEDPWVAQRGPLARSCLQAQRPWTQSREYRWAAENTNTKANRAQGRHRLIIPALKPYRKNPHDLRPVRAIPLPDIAVTFS
jgi:hypothetical protein